jgi:hypothetical protein
MAGVVDVSLFGAYAEVRCDPAACVPVISAIHERRLSPADLRVIHPSLEDAFIALTTASHEELAA